jgi:hypothetical protein
MKNDLYTESGSPLGFRDGNFIYDLGGRLVGLLNGSQVYCMAGHYVGQLDDGVIHDNQCNQTSEKLPVNRNRFQGRQRK